MAKKLLLWCHESLDDAIYSEFYIINVSVILWCRFAKVNMWIHLHLHEKNKAIFLGSNRCVREKYWYQKNTEKKTHSFVM